MTEMSRVLMDAIEKEAVKRGFTATGGADGGEGEVTI
jgi:hypothetical protein